MKNKKFYTGKKLMVALAMTLLFLVPISSQAFTVEIDPDNPNNALGIRNLELDSAFYNVVFRFDSANNIYGVDPKFDWNGEEEIVAATAAVNAALNTRDIIWTVGPQTSELYNIGADEERGLDDPITVTYASAYDDRTPFEWDVAKDKDEGLLGVNLIAPSVSATYADFTPVPIPAAGWLLGGGLIGLLGLRRRFKS